jgi:hypothetical protein
MAQVWLSNMNVARRNLNIANVFIIFYKYAGVTVTSASISGVKLSLENPGAVIQFAWCIWLYALIVYYLHFRDEVIVEVIDRFTERLKLRLLDRFIETSLTSKYFMDTNEVHKNIKLVPAREFKRDGKYQSMHRDAGGAFSRVWLLDDYGAILRDIAVPRFVLIKIKLGALRSVIVTTPHFFEGAAPLLLSSFALWYWL